MIRAAHLPLVTSHHLANLATLATYLEALPRDYDLFRMRQYAGWGPVDPDSPIGLSVHQVGRPLDVVLLLHDRDDAHQCGTSACAVGHGPLAGIIPPDAIGHGWNCYERWAFGVSLLHEGNYRIAWDYMFGPDWPDDPHLAAQRIRVFLS